MLTRAEWIYFALLLLLFWGLYKTREWLAAKNRAYHAAMLTSGCGDSCGGRFAFLKLADLLPSGCGKNNASLPPSPEQQRRWKELRQQLQQTLGEKYNTPIPAATVPQLKRGSELFAQLCASCHGERGDGKVAHPGVLLQPPSNFTDAAHATFFSEQARLQIIRQGIAGTAMMGWGEVLPENDILAIYLYIRYLYQSK
ncbi:MAG: cytochrome c [candidate division KSB1 bacterium]|nr:cytochrome c [candidate division KSB1 bacterium]MDZ7364818.1 cytochrome c [candidate division KSB1 bacterium]MDZ7402921.1 cytochrome c [candidate division KSB1 bacterium]